MKFGKIALTALALTTMLSFDSSAYAQWQPPTGIPTPPFGITQVAGTPTHFVNNTHAAATDTNNPNGSPTQPRLTVPTTLPAGSVVEVRGGPYTLGSGTTWTGSGSASSPAFIKGVGNPIFRDTTAKSTLALNGSYLIVEGVTFENKQLRMDAALHHFCLRGSIVRNYSPTSSSSAINVNGANNVIYNNEVYDNGDPVGATEVDIHGIKGSTGASYIWIVDNHIQRNGGDSVQIGSATADEPWAHHVYIGRNRMHGDRENAVDLKQARDIIVSQNIMYDYQPSSSSEGAALIAHNGTQRVWVLFNELSQATIGAISTGADGFYLIGNQVHDILDATDPSSFHGSMAMAARATTETYFVGNTIWNVNKGISYQSGATKVEFVGNIIGGLTTASFHIGVGSSPIMTTAVFRNNLYGGAFRNLIGSALFTSLSSFRSSYPGQEGNGLNADPLFVDTAAKNFSLRASSPAIDKGLSHALSATFFDLYGVDIKKDYVGTSRPQGLNYDIGAYEFGAPATIPPAAPASLDVN